MNGKHVKRLAKFAVEYPGWHTYGKDRATVSALCVLERNGIIERNNTRQFRLALPQWASAAIETKRMQFVERE